MRCSTPKRLHSLKTFVHGNGSDLDYRVTARVNTAGLQIEKYQMPTACCAVHVVPLFPSTTVM
jgi:hypothetical protein